MFQYRKIKQERTKGRESWWKKDWLLTIGQQILWLIFILLAAIATEALNLFLGPNTSTFVATILHIFVLLIIFVPIKFVVGRIKNSTWYTNKQALDYSTERYGMYYEHINLEARIEKDGSVILRREFVLHAKHEIKRIETFVQVPEEDPEGRARKIESSQPESLSEGYEVSLEDHDTPAGRAILLLVFDPEISPGDYVRYQLKESFSPGTYAINLNSIEISKRKDPWEYLNWNIRIPTRKLSISVLMPDSSAPKIFASDARYSDAKGYATDRLELSERNRIERPILSNVQGLQSELSLVVDFPSMGLFYGIKWRPVAISSIRAIENDLTTNSQSQSIPRLAFDSDKGRQALGLPQHLLEKSVKELGDCRELETDQKLRNEFVAHPFADYRNELPSAEDIYSRAKSLVNFLYPIIYDDQRLLVLFVEMLANNYPIEDDRHKNLASLSRELASLPIN